MPDDSTYSRRQLLKVGGGLTALFAVGYSLRTMQDENQTPTADGLFDQFEKARTVDDLPRPESEPALALTNDGWYEWLEGAAEWTALPSWWAKQLGSPDNPVPEGHVRTLNDTLHLPPDGDLQAAIDEVDGGRIVLQRGEYDVDGRLRIPGNVVIEGQGVDSVITATSDSDMFLVGGQTPPNEGNTVALRNLVLDTTDVSNYSSSVVTFLDEETYHGGVEFLQNVIFHMYGSGEGGTAISLVDRTGSGLTSVTFGNVRLMFPDVGIRMEVNNGGFVNGNGSQNLWARNPRIGIREVVNDGVIRSNNWNFRVNGSEDIERVLESKGDRNRYRLFVFDLVRIPGDAITVDGMQNVLEDQGGFGNLRRWVADRGSENRYRDMSRRLTYLPQRNLPYWLEPSGQGGLTGGTGEVEIAAGPSTGDQFSVAAPDGIFSAWQYPWIELQFTLVGDSASGLTSLGLASQNGEGAYICADPNDGMGTGITDEFIAQLGTGGGGSAEATGVGLGTGTHRMAVRVLQGDQWGQFNVIWVLDGREVRYETGVSERDFHPWFGIETTGRSRPAVRIDEFVELRYSVPR